MDADIGFTFDWGMDSQPEIVMLESHYNLLMDDITTMEGEIDYLKTMVEYLMASAEEEGLELCICQECIKEYRERNTGSH